MVNKQKKKAALEIKIQLQSYTEGWSLDPESAVKPALQIWLFLEEPDPYFNK